MNNGTAAKANGGSNFGTFKVKTGLADMLKGGVIMDVINVEQAKIAEESGAVAIMALERVPADIRLDGGVVSVVGQFVCDEQAGAMGGEGEGQRTGAEDGGRGRRQRRGLMLGSQRSLEPGDRTD